MKILLKNASLLDETYDYQQADVLVDGERIAAVGRDLPADADTDVIDFGGYTLMPGIIDAHVHVVVNDGALYDDHLKSWAKNGVTTVRELGLLSSRPGTEFMEWLETKKSPEFTHVVTAGKYIDIAGGYGDGHRPGDHWGNVITTTDEAVNYVEEHKKIGTDGIKIGILDGRMGNGKPHLPVETVKAMSEKARALDMWFSVHLTEAKTIKWLMDNDCPITDAGHTPYDPIDENTLDLMVQRGVGMITTNGGPDKIPKLPPPVMKNFDFEGFHKMAVARCGEMRNNVKQFYDHGGVVAIGTDTGTDIDDTEADRQELISKAVIPVIELQQLYEAGFPMKEVIKAATINGARICRTDRDEGTITEGKLANLIAFKGELTPDFSELQNLSFVMNRGMILNHQI